MKELFLRVERKFTFAVKTQYCIFQIRIGILDK